MTKPELDKAIELAKELKECGRSGDSGVLSQALLFLAKENERLEQAVKEAEEVIERVHTHGRFDFTVDQLSINGAAHWLAKHATKI